MQVNIHEAKSRLSQLIERVLNGEAVVIAKAGKPVAQLVPIRKTPKRILGSASGTIQFGVGWYAPWNDKELHEFVG